MITGFNTDVEHQGVIYHVQTEDKGLETPLILSLVYNRGTILASKRSPYHDLLSAGFDEKVLAERLQKQHKLICAAVRAGRLEDLKRMTARDASAKAEQVAAAKEMQAVNQFQNQPIQQPSISFKNNSIVQKPLNEKPLPAIPQPKEELIWDIPLEIIEDEPIIEVVNFVEEEEFLSVGTIKILSDEPEILSLETGKLGIEFVNETTFKAGERKTLNIRVFRGNSENYMSGASVMVKVLGSAFRPLIFHAQTDNQGVAIVHLQLPQFRSGRGAILVRATSEGEEVELRQIIRQN